jgi:hypothetical protein
MNKKNKERIAYSLIILGTSCVSVGIGEAIYEAPWAWFYKLMIYGVLIILLGAIYGSENKPGPQAKIISEAERTARYGDGPPPPPMPRR